MNEVNIPLLRKAVEWAEAEAAKPALERQWRQAAYLSSPNLVAWSAVPDDMSTVEASKLVRQWETTCGTAYCIAGYVGQLLDSRYAVQTVVDGVHVSDFAADALGISREDDINNHALFLANNTIEDVRRIAEQLAGEKL